MTLDFDNQSDGPSLAEMAGLGQQSPLLLRAPLLRARGTTVRGVSCRYEIPNCYRYLSCGMIVPVQLSLAASGVPYHRYMINTPLPNYGGLEQDPLPLGQTWVRWLLGINWWHLVGKKAVPASTR